MPHVAGQLRIPFRRVDHDLAEVLEFVVRDDAYASGRGLRELPLGERRGSASSVRDGRPHTVAATSYSSRVSVHVYCQPEDAVALAEDLPGCRRDLMTRLKSLYAAERSW